jgi:hypothetical protein
VEDLFGEGFERCELVDARVVNEDVEASIVLDGCIDDSLCLGCFGDVAFHGDSLAAGRGDGCDDSVRAALARGIIYDYRCAFCGEGLGDSGSDTFGCAGNDGDFTCKLAHVLFWKSFKVEL